jgi:hypothetical protein
MAWQLLFGSDMGLMSLFVIVFVIVMAAFLYSFAKRHMAEDAKQAK